MLIDALPYTLRCICYLFVGHAGYPTTISPVQSLAGVDQAPTCFSNLWKTNGTFDVALASTSVHSDLHRSVSVNDLKTPSP